MRDEAFESADQTETAELGARNALAARYYASLAGRRGACTAQDLVEAGFRAGPILDHWRAIHAAGEALLAKARRYRVSGAPGAAVSGRKAAP